MAQVAKDLRSENRVRIAELLIAEGTLSKAEINRRTGMSAPTVTRIVEELRAYGLVEEGELSETPAVGRKPTGISLKADAVALAGALHEGKWLQVGLMDLRGNILVSEQAQAEGDLSSLLTAQVGGMLQEMMQRVGIAANRLAGVGVGLPAMLDPYGNCILTAPLIGVKEKTDINAEIASLSQRLGAPVRVENDVNAMAIGEHAGRKMGARSDMAYIALGTGIGCGLLLRGELRRGAHNIAGEIGYMCVDTGEEQGRLESLIGTAGLEKRFGVSLGSPLPLDAREAVVDYVARVLAPCIVNLSAALDLSLIALGGHLVDSLGDGLVQRLVERAKRLAGLPLRLERGAVSLPGLYGMGMLMQERFLKQLRVAGLEPLLKR